MLSEAQLASMRSTAAGALPDEAVVQRVTEVSDGGGGTTTEWADLATLACRIAPAGGGEGGQEAGRVEDETTHVVTLAAGADVTAADRLVISGVTYEVTAVRERRAWALTTRCEVKEAP